MASQIHSQNPELPFLVEMWSTASQIPTQNPELPFLVEMWSAGSQIHTQNLDVVAHVAFGPWLPDVDQPDSS